MSKPPANDDDNPYVFDTPPPPRPVQRRSNENDYSITEDIADEAINAVTDRLGGCLLRPVIWLVTLPFRLIWRIIEGIFD